MKFIRNEDIETRTFQIIKNYEKKMKTIVCTPIPLEKIIMQEYNLFLVWDEMNEEEGVEVYGGLCVKERAIILNSKHRNLFERVPGFERSTIGHEAGHFEYDVDKSNSENFLDLGFKNQTQYYHRTSAKYENIFSYRDNIKIKDMSLAMEKLKKFDSPDQRRIVNRFAAALNMPEYLVKDFISKYEINSWVDFYKMKEEFEVSTEALKVRLGQLKLYYLHEGKFVRNKEEAFGQESFGF